MTRITKALICLAGGIMLTGCTLKAFSEKEASSEVQKATPVISAYLDSLNTVSLLEKVEMVRAFPEGGWPVQGSYRSDYAVGTAIIDNQTYYIYTNNLTGEVWSSYYSYLVDECIEDRIRERCEEYGIDDYAVRGSDFRIRRCFTGTDDRKCEIWLENCLPSYVTPETYEEYEAALMDDISLQSFSLFYHSDKEKLLGTGAADLFYYSVYSDFTEKRTERSGICTARNVTADSYKKVIATKAGLGDNMLDVTEKYFWELNYMGEPMPGQYDKHEPVDPDAPAEITSDILVWWKYRYNDEPEELFYITDGQDEE